jgi:sterol desaturase/sphingolipid hydroxylase (fatty acid hydroxylase superfamily)
MDGRRIAMQKAFVHFIGKLYFHGFQALNTMLLTFIWFQYYSNNTALIPILISVLSAFLILLEWRFPARKEWQLSKKEFTKDMFYQVGVYFLYGPFVAALVAPFFIDYLGGALKNYHLAIWPTTWSLLAKIGLALVVTEFFAYWFHRAEHKFPLLWRLHSAHHSPTKMGWTKNRINHPLEYVVLIAIGVIPAALLGAGVAELAGAELIYLITTTFAHSNLNLDHRLLGLFFTTNKYHLRHHSVVLSESLSNYGCSVVLWDRFFGTFKGFKGCEEVGIKAGMNLTLFEELALPFRSTTMSSEMLK